MKIRFEKEVEACWECPLYLGILDLNEPRCCEYDGFEEQLGKMPCELRPCPAEVQNELENV